MPEWKVDVNVVAAELDIPNFRKLVQQFLQDQIFPDISLLNSYDELLPEFNGKVSIHLSAIAAFYAPSDISGVGDMHRKWIQASPSWRNGPPRYDYVFLNTDRTAEGMHSLDVACILLFLSFEYDSTMYPCVLVHWLLHVGDGPDEDTGMWVVQPDLDADGSSIINLDCIVHAHLIPVYGDEFIPRELSLHHSLDAFLLHYVNKFIDHHAFQIAS